VTVKAAKAAKPNAATPGPGSSKPTLRVGAACHRGAVREENQDRISRFRTPFGEVFAVADGMGGHADGGRAAEVTIAALEEELAGLPAGLPAAEALERAADRANGDLHRLSAGAGEGEGTRMGATLVLALVAGGEAVVAHAGDSRAYLFRGGVLEPLTRDHTLVRGMVERGILTEAQAREHPDASVVTRAFGQQPEIELEVADPLELRAGDRLLLCSDGLCGYLDDAHLARAVAGGEGPQEATDRLIELALEAGGEDNVSVQVIEVAALPTAEEIPERPDPVPGRRKPPPPSRRSADRQPWPWLGLGLAAAMVVGLALFLAWWFEALPGGG